MTQTISDFDAGLLLTLEALLKDQNVTHAATRLNITQSALSARLTRLRQLLNDPLFTPAASGRGMVPTPHAVALQPELARLIERFTDFVNTAHLFDLATSKLRGVVFAEEIGDGAERPHTVFLGQDHVGRLDDLDPLAAGRCPQFLEIFRGRIDGNVDIPLAMQEQNRHRYVGRVVGGLCVRQCETSD